ncbi:MAG: hypothetical protein ACLTEP_08515 [Collinsella sp.]
MGSDQEATCEKDCKFLFDDFRDEMERVKPLLDLDHWSCEFGAEALDDLVNKLASENTHNNDTYKLAKCFISRINSDDNADDDSDCYAFYMALIEELGIDPDAVKDVKDNYFGITLPMSDGPFTVSVKPFDPYVPEQLWNEVGKKVDPRWHYFVSWAKYWDVFLNSNSEYAEKLRERDTDHKDCDAPTSFRNRVMKKWLGRS